MSKFPKLHSVGIKGARMLARERLGYVDTPQPEGMETSADISVKGATARQAGEQMADLAPDLTRANAKAMFGDAVVAVAQEAADERQAQIVAWLETPGIGSSLHGYSGDETAHHYARAIERGDWKPKPPETEKA